MRAPALPPIDPWEYGPAPAVHGVLDRFEVAHTRPTCPEYQARQDLGHPWRVPLGSRHYVWCGDCTE